MRDGKNGFVYLIGAGPGDPALLTVKGKRCLQEADVIVGDYLADQRILAWAPKWAEYIYVGKKAGCHAKEQEDISRLLVKEAKEGKCVVRLKGGDPFVFGRGGEEALLLEEEGIPFEVVPGVTSAIAAPAYAGIPVTHRGVAASFAVITGHEDPHKKTSAIHWDKLATAVDTLVFLMGVGQAGHIAEELMKNGRAPETPAAFIRWGTRLDQEVYVTTLGKAGDDVARLSIKPPAVFIVGDVVNLRDKLRWFDNKPLFGKTVVVTRSRTQASRMTASLEELGARCIEIPTIDIQDPTDGFRSLDQAISHVGDYEWILFTSTNGVDRFFDRLAFYHLDARALYGAKVAAIGPATADDLKQHGIRADCIPVSFKAEDLLEELTPQIKKGMKVLIPRAKEARNVLPEGLEALGAEVDVVEAYCTVPATEHKAELLSVLEEGKADIITFTSSSTVVNLMNMIDGRKDLLEKPMLAAIGPITAGTCRRLGLRPGVEADTYTIEGLTSKIEEWSRQK